jgi:hypothetical protein
MWQNRDKDTDWVVHYASAAQGRIAPQIGTDAAK